MSAPKSLLQDLLGFLADLHQDAQEMLSDDVVRNAIVADLGGDPSATTSAPQFPPAGLQSVTDYRNASEPGLEALFAAIQDIRAYHNALRAFVESLDLGPDAAVDEGLRALLDILGWNLIRLRKPQLYFVMQALSFVEDFTSVYGGQFNGPIGLMLALDRLLFTILNPCGWFEQSHFSSERGVTRISDRMAIGGLAGVKIFGLSKYAPADEIFYGWDVVPGVATATQGDLTLARDLGIAAENAGRAGPVCLARRRHQCRHADREALALHGGDAIRRSGERARQRGAQIRDQSP
jgi:hypothetical protein